MTCAGYYCRRGATYSRKEIFEFLGSFTKYAAIDANPPDGLVCLTNAARTLTAIRVNRVGILKLMIEGEIQGYLQTGQPRIGDVRFDPRDLQNYIIQFRKEKGWLTRVEVAKELGVSLKHVSKFIRDGILSVDVSCGAQNIFSATPLEKPQDELGIQ